MIKRIGFTDDKVVIGYPSLGIQVFAFLTVSLGLCVNAGIVSSRREHYWHIATKPRPRHATWRATALLLATFAMSLVFTWTVGFLQFAVGLANNAVSCRAAILICVTAYASTKVITNLFLLERLWIISGCQSWREARQWQFGMGAFLLGLPLLGAFFASSKSRLDDNLMCHIGLHAWGTIGLVAWDACLNLMLSIMFALKCRSKALALDSPLRGLAMRTLGVTGISTVTSLVNITVMAALKYELGAVCLSLCTLDVLVDALTLALLTSSRYDARDSRLARTPKYHPEEERLQASIKAPSIIHMVKCEVEEKTPVQSAWAHDMVVELAVPPSAAAAGVPTFLHGDQYEGRWANDYLEEVHSESKSRDRTEAYV